jgi:hypothetical protein
MPVEQKAVRRATGEHSIDRRNEWCLMWTAPPGRGVTVEGAWTVHRAAR